MPELDMQALVAAASEAFDVACQERHDMGAEKYGPVKFLDPDNDLFRMLKEELVDAANYARYLFIRLSALEAMLANAEEMSDQEVPGQTSLFQREGAVWRGFVDQESNL